MPEPPTVPGDGLVGHLPAAASCLRRPPTRRERWRWLLLGDHRDPPVGILMPIEEPRPERAGICCSGGGIRSASFNLGALQAIQTAGLLQKVKYLAAVSGGSYIAAAFAMVAKTRDEGVRDPRGDDSDPTLVTPAYPPFHPGSPEEQYLRNRASYMAPTGSGKVLLVWRVLLGLLVNLALIAAVLTLVAALLALYYRSADPGLIRPAPAGTEVGASPDGTVWGAGLALSGLGLLMGAFSVLIRPRRRDGLRQFLEVWSLPVFAAGLGIFVIELVIPILIDVLRKDGKGNGTVRGAGALGGGVSATVAGILGAVLIQLRATVADPAKAIEGAETKLAQLAPRARLAVIYVATTVLGPLLLLVILVAATMVQVETTYGWLQYGVPAAAFGVVFMFVRFGDLTSWSLHPFYRRRLCTAFALRRVRRPGDPPTGRAEARDEGELVPLSATGVRPRTPPWPREEWPTLIVCAAANVSDPGATPPGRGVTSFTFSATEMGGPLVGGVRTADFESALSPNRQRDFTLAAAVAMSGAAISPSMGKVTRPSVRFLMAMANVRLGVWLPNPRRMESFVKVRPALSEAGKTPLEKLLARVGPVSRFDPEARANAVRKAVTDKDCKRRFMPRPTPRYLLKELLGWNSIDDKFLYVTDGGHYENLGLVELLRRGCTEVYCFDASGGEEFGALGDAIALARSELGVEIDFPDGELEALRDTDGPAERRCATGTLTYTRGSSQTGRIVYAPTVMSTGLPWDLKAFKRSDDEFPHHSTLDQLFTDQKFEAYRMLGWEAAKSAIEAMHPPVVKPAAGNGSGGPPARRPSDATSRGHRFSKLAGRLATLRTMDLKG